jgi:hypothetical protein
VWSAGVECAGLKRSEMRLTGDNASINPAE